MSPMVKSHAASVLTSANNPRITPSIPTAVNACSVYHHGLLFMPRSVAVMPNTSAMSAHRSILP